MDCSVPGSSVHVISQARILKQVVISFFMGSSRPRDKTHISCIGRQILYHWATKEAYRVVQQYLLKNCAYKWTDGSPNPCCSRVTYNTVSKPLYILIKFTEFIWILSVYMQSWGLHACGGVCSSIQFLSCVDFCNHHNHGRTVITKIPRAFS